MSSNATKTTTLSGDIVAIYPKGCAASFFGLILFCLRALKGAKFSIVERESTDAPLDFSKVKRLLVFGPCVSDDIQKQINDARNDTDETKRLAGLNMFMPSKDGFRHIPSSVWTWLEVRGYTSKNEIKPAALQYLEDSVCGYETQPDAPLICRMLNGIDHTPNVWKGILDAGPQDLFKMAKSFASEQGAKKKAAESAKDAGPDSDPKKPDAATPEATDEPKPSATPAADAKPANKPRNAK